MGQARANTFVSTGRSPAEGRKAKIGIDVSAADAGAGRPKDSNRQPIALRSSRLALWKPIPLTPLITRD
jgi:hypothetical protein